MEAKNQAELSDRFAPGCVRTSENSPFGNSGRPSVRKRLTGRFPGADFKEELFSRKQAWITVEYSDGHSKCNLWRIDPLTPQSNIVGNLRSRPEFRSGKWQKLGIVRVSVTLSPPGQ